MAATAVYVNIGRIPQSRGDIDDNQKFTNIAATTAVFNLDGGKYGVTCKATYGGGSVTLQIRHSARHRRGIVGAVVSHAQLQAYRALRGDPDIPELLAILRELAADRRIAISEAIEILREARDQAPMIAAEIDGILAELETARKLTDAREGAPASE
jgi:hypothetical protein